MALSIIQFSYNLETDGNLVKNPEDRSVAVKNLIEKLGGKLLAFYYTYGDYDGFLITDMPDNKSTLATVIAAFSAGGTAKLKTTVLITVEEAMFALKKASGLKLQQPKA